MLLLVLNGSISYLVKRRIQDESVLKSTEEVFVFRGLEGGGGNVTEDGGNLQSEVLSSLCY